MVKSFLKKSSAVVTLIRELAGVGKLVGGSVLRMIKNTAIKEMNKYKKRYVRRGATLKDISEFVKEIYIKKKNSSYLKISLAFIL